MKNPRLPTYVCLFYLFTVSTNLLPGCDQNGKARGMFTSVYMLRTFAPHLAVVSQSHIEESKPQFGALAMAAAAVSCFRYLAS